MDPGQSICLLFGSLAMIGAVITRMWFSHEERKLKIRSQGQNTSNDGLQPQIDARREELVRLRDTATQYDISIQHTLEDLQNRVATMESRNHKGSGTARIMEGEEANVVINRSS